MLNRAGNRKEKAPVLILESGTNTEGAGRDFPLLWAQQHPLSAEGLFGGLFGGLFEAPHQWQSQSDKD